MLIFDAPREAVLAILDFAPNTPTSPRRSRQRASHAAVVGSGRVGLAQLVILEEKERLAARAHIRHRYAKYERQLSDLPFEAGFEDDPYREVKGAAHEAVDDFLDEHRDR